MWEPAWHRKQRRSRTRSRTLLRGWISGDITADTFRVQQAIGRLRGHHSSSSLPAAAQAKLDRLSQNTNVNMQHQGQVSPWCDWCRLWARKDATTCKRCGWPVFVRTVPPRGQSPRGRTPYRPDATPTPWGDSDWSTWGRDPSPRPHTDGRRPSRRRNSDEQNAAKGKGTNKGKGKDTPDILQLPQPPSAQIMAPARGVPIPGAFSGSASEDHRVLQSLLSALAKTDTLPDEVRQIAAQAQVNQAQQEGKALSKLVALRTDARKNLEQLDKQRAAYEQSWTHYMNQLFEMVEKQLQEREATLVKMESSRESWLDQLSGATRQLKGIIQDATVPNELPDDDMQEIREAESLDAKESELEADRRRKEEEKRAKLRQALAAAREATLAETGRERTPRRKREPIAIELSPAKDGRPTEVPPDPWIDPQSEAKAACPIPAGAQGGQSHGSNALLPFGKASRGA